jgi:lipoate-protein ligase A
MLWRLLDTPPAPGAWNMALDEALAESVAEGGAPVLRFYRWSPACLSLGRNQPAAGRYDLDALARRGWEVVRRPTGGRAVLHHRELTYSVALPRHPPGLPARRVHRPQPRAGGRAAAAGRGRGGAGRHGAARPRSLAGPLLRGAGGGGGDGRWTQAGGERAAPDGERPPAARLPSAARRPSGGGGAAPPTGGGGGPAAALVPLLGREPAWEELVAALAQGWREALGAEVETGAPPGARGRAAEVLAARYNSTAWTWHR